jgi:hypothetical protein
MATRTVPPLLVIKYQGIAGGAQVFRLHGGVSLIPVGPPLPVSTLEAPVYNTSIASNRVLKFGQHVYAIHRNRIWQLDEGGAPTEGDDSWVQVHLFSNISTGNGYANKTGLYLVNVGNTPTLMSVYLDTGQFLRMITTTDGVTWTESGVLHNTPVSSAVGWGRSVLFRNKLYTHLDDANLDMVEVDPLTQLATFHNSSSHVAAVASSDMCVFDNRLWYIGWTTTSAAARPLLSEHTNGNLVARSFVETGGLPNHSGHEVASAMCLFTDDDSLYAIFVGDDGGGAGGTYCFRWQLSAGPGSTLSISEVTANVVPFSLRAGFVPDPGLYTDNEVRWYAYNDNSDPSNPCVHLWHLTTARLGLGRFTYYRWNGPNTLMGIPAGTGQISVTPEIAMPHVRQGGGERIWSPGKVNVEILGRAAVENGQAFNFRVYSGGGTTAKKVRFFYDTEEESARLPATIRPSSISGGMATFGQDSISDYVDDIEADDNTIYCFIWDTVVDGVEQGDNVILMPVIEEC